MSMFHVFIIIVLALISGFYLYYHIRQTIRKSTEKVFCDYLNELTIGGYVRRIKGKQKRYLVFNHIVQYMYGAENVANCSSWSQKEEDDIDDKMGVQGMVNYIFERRITNAQTGETTYVMIDKKRLPAGSREYYIITTLKDITVKHHEEEDLLNARRSLDLAIEAAGIMAWDYSLETQKYRMLYGEYIKKDVDEIRDICALIHPDDRAGYLELVKKLLSGECSDDKAAIEVRIPEESGKISFYKCTVLMTRDSWGKPFSLVGAFLNITQRKEDETIIKRNTDFLYAILDNIPFPIHVKDVTNSYRYNFWNETGKELFGDIEGEDASAFLIKEHAEYCESIDRMVYNTNEVYHKQEVMYLRDGRVIEMIVHKSAIYSNTKKLILTVYWVIDDVLKLQRELEDVCRRNEIIINNTNSGLAYITSDYMVQWENISACSPELAFETYQKGQLCYASAYGKKKPCENCLLQNVMLSKRVDSKEFALENGRHIEVFANPVLKHNGELEGIVIRVDDITARQKMLDDLNYAKQKAEESALLQSTFLENVTHEIRTPLNAIVGFSDLLINTQQQQEREEFGEIIAKNNELLLRIVNDILELSKIEAGMFNTTMMDVDLTVLFGTIVLSFETKTSEGVTLCFEAPSESYVFYTDPERLTQIMTNFLVNAIKFTFKGQIRIGYECIEEGVRCYVSDTGIGIEKDKIENVFGRFEKVDRFTQGTGLGLSICKAIVEAYGGKIGLESELGKGSTFWIWLPQIDK